VSGPPPVRLGHQAPNGIAAGLLALVERGAAKRPRVARELQGRVEIRFAEDYAPVRLQFGDQHVLVEDGNGRRWRSDLVIEGRSAARLWPASPHAGCGSRAARCWRGG
jgi:hypothetical protein